MLFNKFKLERYMARYEFKAKYLFSCSDPTSYTINNLLNLTPNPQESLKELGEVYLGYTES